VFIIRITRKYRLISKIYEVADAYVSLGTNCGLIKTASKSSQFPIFMQISVACTERRGDKSTWLCEICFLTAKAVPPFLPKKLSVKLKCKFRNKNVS
jgi:hypothetical protein